MTQPHSTSTKTAKPSPGPASKRNMLLVLLAATALYTSPSWLPVDDTESLRAAVKQNREQAATLSAQLEQLRGQTKDRAAFDTRDRRLGIAVPNGPDLIGLIDAVEQAAAGSGLRWTAGAPARTELLGTSSQSWTITMSLTGDRTGVPVFLDQLRNLDRYVVVDSISYQRLNATQSAVQITARFFSLTADDSSAKKGVQ